MSGASRNPRNASGRSGPLDAVLALREKFGGGNDRGAAGKGRSRASFNLRNRLLPLVSLDKLLQLTDETRDAAENSFIIVTQVGTYVFGIIVDRVYDMEEIVVKPVAPLLRDLSLFSGNTILGDGSVVMILDPNGIAAATGEIAPTDDASIETDAAAGDHFGTERADQRVRHSDAHATHQ